MGETLAGPDLPATEKDSDKTAAAAAGAAPSKRVPPPIPPRKRDSQLSIVRKESEQRLAPQQPNSKDDLPPEGPEGDLKDGGGDEKGRAAISQRRGSTPREKQRPLEETHEGPASSSGSAGSGKPEVAPRGKDVEESLVFCRVSNGGSRHDDVRGGGHVQGPNEGGADVRLPEIPNGSAPSSFHGTSVLEKRAPSSECGGAKREAEDRERERQAELVNLDQQHRPDPESESESEPRPRVAVGRPEEIERDSESDSEEGKPLLKERGEASPGSGEGTKSAPFGSEGDAILAAFDDD